MASDWQAFNGGECPVHPETLVQIQTFGEVVNGTWCPEIAAAGGIDWRHTGKDSDVSNFRTFGPPIKVPVEERKALYAASDAIQEAMKPTNPKDGVASNKMPLHLVSGVVKAYQAIAHFLGNVKYGAWNYLAGGARASVYKAALDRHMDRWWSGEECDPIDGTPHLANALACINILIECSHRGNLLDDRPPSTDLAPLYARLEALMPTIRERYKHLQPKHWTIGDMLSTAE